MRYLITSSLLSAWRWQYICPESFKVKALDDFRRTLRREVIPTNAAMQRGHDFESLACGLADRLDCRDLTGFETWSGAAAQIADIIRGGAFQFVAYKDLTIGDIDFFLYGRLDVLKGTDIYDIKFTGKYTDGKYLAHAQHSMYFEIVPYARKFEYLVSDGEQVWREVYTRDESRPISERIQEFIDDITQKGLVDEYFTYWQSREE